jgi:hypothetical protein
MASISSSVGAYESGAVNRPEDVRTVQELLTSLSRKLNSPLYDPKGVDGKIARNGNLSGTVKAIAHFQKTQVGMLNPNKRIDVGGATWMKLQSLSGPVAIPRTIAPVTGLITLTVTHNNKIPTGTKFKNITPATASGLYESDFTLSGGLNGSFRGSVYPDDMTVKGRVVDGTYPLHIGFHKGGGGPKQTASDLVVKTRDIRAGLLVNARNPVNVQSDSPTKKTSVGINVHNGFNNARYSDGCLTLHPQDWQRFIQLFLDAFHSIDDWHTLGTNTGKQIGSLIIRAL